MPGPCFQNIAMRYYRLPLVILACFMVGSTPVSAAAVSEAVLRMAGEVAKLKIGMGEYILGENLTDNQKAIARSNPIEKSLPGTYKFRDKDIFIVAVSEEDISIGIYKVYPECTMDDIKKIVGNLMLDYGEPTTTAHDKIIYWNYNKKGKISRDVFDFEKTSGIDPLGTIKFSSSEGIDAEQSAENPTPISAYLMITSDPLSKVFLADIKQDNQ